MLPVPVNRAARTALGLSFILALMLATAVSGQPVQLAPDQLRTAATAELRNGAPQRALGYADALIARDSDDRVALLIRARALRDLQRFDEASKAASAAWSLAEIDSQRYAAAMVLAQIKSSNGQRTYAQLWLRRAVQAAPDEALKQRAIRDFRYVRARNPWSTRLTFGVTPDSNINNGSSSRSSFLNYRLTEILFGEQVEFVLSGAARALSGVEYSLGFDTRFRFLQTANRANDLFFSLDLRRYSLSNKAKEIAPGAEASDFAFTSYRLGYGHRGYNFSNRGEFALRADIGQSWYGDKEYARFLRGSVIQSYALSGRTRLNGRLAAEKQFGVATSDLQTLRADLWVARVLPSGNRLRVFAAGAVATSPNPTEEFGEWALRASLELGQLWKGVYLQLGLGYRMRDYDFSIHSFSGRRDERLNAEATFIFERVDYLGFNPTMTIYAQKTDSNIGLYKSKRLGINFGIQSAF